MSTDPFAARGRSLEEAYYRKKDSELVDKLRKVFETTRTKEDLRKAGITDEEVLERLINLNVHGELLTAFKLFPLVEIAWADGGVDDREAQAVVQAAIKSGVAADGEAIARLKEWLKRGPKADGRAAWYLLAGELRRTLTRAELDTFRQDLLKYANEVAKASGGILGIALQVSPEEKRVIDKVAKALTHE